MRRSLRRWVFVLALVPPTLCALSLMPTAVRAGEGDAMVRNALSLAAKDHYADAARVARSDPMLAKLIRWKDYSSSSPSGDFDDITNFITNNPDWPLLGPMQRRAEAAITAATPAAQVLAWFQAHPPQSVDGAMALARAYQSVGQNEKAAEVARKAWVEGNFGAIQERQFLSQFSEVLRPEDHWLRLDRLLWDKNQSAARAMLLRVDAPHRELAQARISLQEDKGGADGAVNRVAAKLRDDPGLIYDRVRWRRQHDMNEDAIDLLSHPSRNLVRPDLWWTERAILARWALQKGWISRAYQVASDNGLPTDANQTVDAEFLSGWIALRFLNDWETAQLHFQKVSAAATTSVSRARGAYWQGRAAEAAGNSDEAQRQYSAAAQMITTFYGQLAAAKLSQHRWSTPSDPEPTAEDIKRFKSRELVRAVNLMAIADDSDGMRPFLIRLNEIVQSPGERTLIAQLALETKRKDLGLAVARKADRDGVTLLNVGWPTLHIAEDSGVEKALILSVIRQESGFIADAESQAGAKGLMQLLPSTAQKLARAIRMAFSPKKLDEPAVNIRLGAAYLDNLLSDFQGSYILAVASYNAGPGRARRWIKEMGDPREANVDVVDWIESIPFTETRNYVQRVMESVEVYRRRLGLSPGGGLEADLKRWAKRDAG